LFASSIRRFNFSLFFDSVIAFPVQAKAPAAAPIKVPQPGAKVVPCKAPYPAEFKKSTNSPSPDGEPNLENLPTLLLL
jgi:hypothetical protein